MIRAASLAILVVLLAGCLGPRIRVAGEPIRTLLLPGMIPAVTEPEFGAPGEPETRMAPEEPVLGIEGGDGVAPKAYPVWMLEWHEVVNDCSTSGPIAITW